MKKLLIVFFLLVLPCIALANERGTVHEPPTEVLEYIESRWSVYELEDYLDPVDVTEDNYSFALVWANDTRYLLGFCQENGAMKNWLDSAAAVPQTKRKASLYCYEPGAEMNYIWDSKNEHAYVIGGNIGVSVPNQWHETMESCVYFEWTDECFCLKSYRDHFWDVDIVGDTLYFWDIGNGLRNQVETWVQTDIRYVDFASLPKRADDIAQDASAEAVIPQAYGEGVLHAEAYSFEPDQQYPVYNGPGVQYQRAGNGKASVSTNDWIQVFGEYDGWIMIQYAISDERYRIGWITRDALPEDLCVDPLSMQGGDWYTLGEDYELTDDPLSSKAVLCEISKNTQVEGMMKLGYVWTYVRVTMGEETWWGFVPSELLGRG